MQRGMGGAGRLGSMGMRCQCARGVGNGGEGARGVGGWRAGKWIWVVAAAGLGVGGWGCEKKHLPGEAIDANITVGSLGDTPGKFAYPRAIDGTADGTGVWVIDKTARVQRIDPATGRCTAMWRMPDSDLGKPVGFCVAPGRDESGAWCDELLYIADTHYARVMVYRPPAGEESANGKAGSENRPTPTLVKKFGEYGQGEGQFIYPTDVAVLLGEDGAGTKRVERIYVGEYGGNDRISVFDGDYRFQFSFGAWGDGRDAKKVLFARPQGLVIMDVAGKKELVVTDSCNHRIGRFTLDGELTGWIGSPERMGEAPGEFRFPYGIAGLGDGTVMVSEFGGNRVQRIDVLSGKSLGVWGRTGQGAGELAAPWAVTVVGKEVFVVDSGNNRVMGFARPG